MSLLHPLIGEPTDLTGRVALVAGATGRVGRGIAAAFLHAGASVVVSSRSARRLRDLHDGLRGRTDRLAALVAPIGEPAGAAHVLRFAHERFGTLDAVADALGPCSKAQALSRVTPAAWRRAMAAGLTARFVVARTFLPALADRRGASYTLTACYAGLRPDPQSGTRSVTMAGALMMHRALAEEYAGRVVRLNAVVLGPVAPLPAHRARPGPALPDGEGAPPPQATTLTVREAFSNERAGSTPEDDALKRQPSVFPARPADAWLTPFDVGAFVALLASDAGAVVSGETIRLLDRAQLRMWMGT